MRHRGLSSLPSPKGLPILGQLLSLERGRLHTTLEGWAKELGPLYTLKVPGKSVLVVGDPAIARAALRARPNSFRRYSTMKSVIEELGVEGVFTAEGAEWRRQRKLVMAGFNSRAIVASFDSVREITERLRRHWSGRAEPVDVVAELMRYTVDVTGAVAFGKDFDTLSRGPDVLRRHLAVLFPGVARRLNSPVPYWRVVRMPVDRELDRAVAAVHGAVLELVREARAGLESEQSRRESPRTLIEALILASDADDPNDRFSDDEVISNVLTVLLAGEDTTANTIAWMLHYAACRPDVLSRLRAEADEVLGDALVIPTFAEVRRLEYATALTHETLRARPVGPVIFLETIGDEPMGGVRVPRGTPVFVLARHVMHDDAHFGDPAEFLPERWLADERPAKLTHDPKADLSFGAGPRICPGRPLALLECAMVISMVARSFALEPIGEVRERLHFTLEPEGLSIRFTPRSP